MTKVHFEFWADFPEELTEEVTTAVRAILLAGKIPVIEWTSLSDGMGSHKMVVRSD